jgi:5-methylcytosine-specific restriction endonuclease McrBC regulatory subunit McrC
MTSQRPDDIVCFEIGSGVMPAWTGSRRELGNDWAPLQAQVNRGVIQLDVRGDRVAIRGASRVGLVMLPSGRRLIVRSKISGVTLLEWLAYLGDFPRLTSWLPDAGVSTGHDWPQCIARLFLYALEHVTRRHLRKEYVTVTADDSEIRGRILTTELVRQLHRLPRVPQLQRNRTLDTPFNIVLALALDRLPSLLSNRPDELRRVARLRDQWAHITRHINDPLTAVTAAQWASPPGYREVLQLARLILVGAALDPTSNCGGQAFTLPLAIVWERALRRMFDDMAAQTGWRRLGDSQRIRRWDDVAGRDDPKRWMTADLIVERSGARWVLDAKYKREFGDENRVDRFQMCAYAVAFDAETASLVYPTAEGPGSFRTLLSTVVNGKIVRIDSIGLPMAAGPESCLALLTSIVRGDAN